MAIVFDNLGLVDLATPVIIWLVALARHQRLFLLAAILSVGPKHVRP